MASLLSTTATPFCASTKKISVAKSLSNRRCNHLIGPFIVLDAESAFLANTMRKLKPYGMATVCFFQQNKPLVVSLSHLLARAYVGDDSGNTHAEDDDDDYGEGMPPDSESRDDSIEIEIEKTGNNSRRIRSKVVVQASLQTVWDILTDYERLADFIPGLAVNKLLEKRDNFARLYQVGEQNLAFGLKFNAKGTIDCFEKNLQVFPSGQKRDIDFNMVEGDFQLFEGKWSVEQSDSIGGQEFQTTLLYIVHVKPKVWLPVQLVEGRLCNEIRTNLSCIRDEAEKAFRNTHAAL